MVLPVLLPENVEKFLNFNVLGESEYLHMVGIRSTTSDQIRKNHTVSRKSVKSRNRVIQSQCGFP